MINNYNIITLCGSTKFKDEFLVAQKELTLQGNIVISVGLFGHADGDYQTVLTDEIKVMLDDMHKRKIDLADEIYVINKGGYIGNSTKSEIEYAVSIGKVVKYLEEITTKQKPKGCYECEYRLLKDNGGSVCWKTSYFLLNIDTIHTYCPLYKI